MAVKTKAARKLYKDKPKKAKSSSKKKGKRANKRKSEQDEEEWFCLECQGPYSSSKTGWIEYLKCKGWSHETCVNDLQSYKCSMCL